MSDSDNKMVYDIDNVIKAVNSYKEHRDIKGFFIQLLLPLYSSEASEYDFIDPNVRHVIYRLSDFVPESERRNIEIYPSPNGSVIINGCPWASLEDWRKEWEIHNPFIPEYIKLLPPEDLLKLREELKQD